MSTPDEAVAGVQRMPDLALPVIVVGDQARASRALISDPPTQLTSPVDLCRSRHRHALLQQGSRGLVLQAGRLKARSRAGSVSCWENHSAEAEPAVMAEASLQHAG